MKTITDVVTSWATDVDEIKNSLVKTHGILQTGYVRPATHGLKDIVNVNDGLPSATFGIAGYVSATSGSITTSTLTVYPSNIFEPVSVDIVTGYAGGYAGYIADTMPQYIRGMSNSLASQAIYGVANDASGFIGINDTAITGSQYEKTSATATGSIYTSIYAVKWDNACSWVETNEPTEGYEALPNFFRYKAVPSSTLYYDGTGNKEVYPFTMRSFLSLAIHDATCVWAIKNLNESDSNAALTLAMLDRAIDGVKGSPFDTVVYVSRMGRRMINALANGKFQYNAMDANKYSNYITSYNGIPLVLQDAIVNTSTLLA